MKLGYNVTGMERKSLVGAISSTLNLPTRYLGMPTAAYEIGKYTINKVGTVTGPDSRDLAATLQGLHGFTPVSEEYDGPAPEAEETPAFAAEDGAQACDAHNSEESGRLVVEIPLTGFTPEKLDNLAKLVNAKAPLLKAALGTNDLPIQQTADTLKFPWFGDGLDADAVRAYITLISKLCEAAKAKRRVLAREKDVSNFKYDFRCFLLSLGFIGGEYRRSRAILLSRLSGNSSFKGGSRPIYVACCYTFPNGEEGEATDCATDAFTSLAKAKAYCDAFAAECAGTKFAGAHVEDEGGKYLYELSLS